MKWRQYGRNAILVKFAESPDEWAFHKCRAMSRALSQKAPATVIEFVPGYTTMLIEFDLSGADPLEKLAGETITFLEEHGRKKVPLGPLHKIPVKYDGPDLARVAKHNGISEERVVKFHTAPVYKVHLLGFAPGFPYLGELHHKLRTPRLDAPRPKVSAGSVAIGGEHTGVYPVDSPGGWNIIGRTNVKIFDPMRAVAPQEEDAFLLKPGDQVQFVSI
ncbi:MAG TPA: 5-oxoprolinase subunit PxpB [Verrucomicrobiae bacterium]|jgi:KipI family sensor histidine kinase inhibitor|nr:5-oxoprolinase subunit PxpB [Verrucomicrobiae bacterium]